jgi:hypothetical protein
MCSECHIAAQLKLCAITSQEDTIQLGGRGRDGGSRNETKWA